MTRIKAAPARMLMEPFSVLIMVPKVSRSPLVDAFTETINSSTSETATNRMQNSTLNPICFSSN